MERTGLGLQSVENYVKLVRVIVDLVPKQIFKLFQSRWNEKFKERNSVLVWETVVEEVENNFRCQVLIQMNQSDTSFNYEQKICLLLLADPKVLEHHLLNDCSNIWKGVDTEVQQIGGCETLSKLIDMVEKSSEVELCDPSVLFLLVLFAPLGLTHGDPCYFEVHPAGIDRRNISHLLEIREAVLSNAGSMSICGKDFMQLSRAIKEIAKAIFDEQSAQSIQDILESTEPGLISDKLRCKLYNQKEFSDMLRPLKLMTSRCLHGVQPENNYVKLVKIILEIVPRELRKVLSKIWGKKFTDSEQRTVAERIAHEVNQNDGYKKVLEQMKENCTSLSDEQRYCLLFAFPKLLERPLLNGACVPWERIDACVKKIGGLETLTELHGMLSNPFDDTQIDPSVLFLLLLCSPLGLAIDQVTEDMWYARDLRVDITHLFSIRKSILDEVGTMSVSKEKFDGLHMDVMQIAKTIFDQEAVSEIESVIKSIDLGSISNAMRDKLNAEKLFNDKLCAMKLLIPISCSGWQSVENYAILVRVIVDIVPKQIFKLFQSRWNKTFKERTSAFVWNILVEEVEDNVWCQAVLKQMDQSETSLKYEQKICLLLLADPEVLEHHLLNDCSNIWKDIDTEVPQIGGCATLSKLIDMVQKSSEVESCDPSVFFLLVLFAPLGLTIGDPCYFEVNRAGIDRINISRLLEIRETVLSNAGSMSICDKDFMRLSRAIKEIAKAIFDDEGAEMIRNVFESTEPGITYELRSMLYNQKEFSDKLCPLKLMTSRCLHGVQAENSYIKLVKIILEIVPMELRTILSTRWNRKFMNSESQTVADSTANDRWNVLSQVESNCTSLNYIQQCCLLFAFPELLELPLLNDASMFWMRIDASVKLIGGLETLTELHGMLSNPFDDTQIDPSVLFLLLLFSPLGLTIEDQDTPDKPSAHLIHIGITHLFLIRKSILDEVGSMPVSDTKFDGLCKDVMDIAKAIFSTEAVDAIQSVVYSRDLGSISDNMRSNLYEQQKFSGKLCAMKLMISRCLSGLPHVSKYFKLMKIILEIIPEQLLSLLKRWWSENFTNNDKKDVWTTLGEVVWKTVTEEVNQNKVNEDTLRELEKCWKSKIGKQQLCLLLFPAPDVFNCRIEDKGRLKPIIETIEDSCKYAEKNGGLATLAELSRMISDTFCGESVDPSVVFRLLRFPPLKFVVSMDLNVRGSHNPYLSDSVEIDYLWVIRKKILDHADSMFVSDENFQHLSNDILGIAETIFGTTEVKKIESVLKCADFRPMSDDMRSKLYKQQVFSGKLYELKLMMSRRLSKCEPFKNYVKLVKIMVEIVPKYLSEFFKSKWDIKFPHAKLSDEAREGLQPGRVYIGAILDAVLELDYCKHLLESFPTGNVFDASFGRLDTTCKYRQICGSWTESRRLLALFFAPPELLEHRSKTDVTKVWEKMQCGHSPKFFQTIDKLEEMIANDHWKSWDPSITFLMLLFAPLGLVEQGRPHYDRESPSGESESIYRLWVIRNKIFEHCSSMKVSKEEFDELWRDIKSTVCGTFGDEAWEEMKVNMGCLGSSLLSDELEEKLSEQLFLNNKFLQLSSSIIKSFVDWKHWRDLSSAFTFVAKPWQTNSVKDREIKMDSMITFAVSTSIDTTVLLILRGTQTFFTVGTYSKDPLNPWHISQRGIESKGLAEYIQECWDGMRVIPDCDRSDVNRIAPHILYVWRDTDWEQVGIRNDKVTDQTVRFKVFSMEVWSHPPNNNALETALRDTSPRYNQVLGLLKKSIDTFASTWRTNTNTGSVNCREKILNKAQKVIRGQLDTLYELYMNLSEVPTSYSFPTLQLALIPRNGSKESGQLIRYGGTFSGVYGRNDNCVHHICTAKDVKERPLPEKMVVFKKVLEQVVSQPRNCQSATDELLFRFR